MNTFGVTLQICGLSPHQASHFLDVPPRVVARWMRGVGRPTVEALAALGDLQARQQNVADAIITSWDEAGRPASLAITVARDDDQAREMGWPSLAAQIAPAAIAQTVLGPISIELDHGAVAEVDAATIAAE